MIQTDKKGADLHKQTSYLFLLGKIVSWHHDNMTAR